MIDRREFLVHSAGGFELLWTSAVLERLNAEGPPPRSRP